MVVLILNLALGVNCILVQPKGGIYNLFVELTRLKSLLPLVDLYLIFGKSSLKNQAQQTEFQTISNLIVTACVACKNLDRNRQKIHIVKIDYLN